VLEGLLVVVELLVDLGYLEFELAVLRERSEASFRTSIALKSWLICW
jgi:hypothetical protein